MPIQQREAESSGSASMVIPGREGDLVSMSPLPPCHRWGVILAGGDGTRLRPLTRLVSGDDRPKQFCPLVTRDTLLEQTRKRAARSIPEHHLLFSLSQDHATFYLQEAAIRPAQRMVQPSNRGTAPPILHGLLSIARIDPDAIVAILPCDHHYADGDAFTATLESAFEVAGRRPESVVLLGAHPQGPEVEYGWMELAAGEGLGKLYGVERFFEKPSFQMANELMRRGALWNTFVMVGQVGAFLEMIRAALPQLMEAFPTSALWAGSEVHIPDRLYYRLPSTDFSQCVLSRSAPSRRLIALPIRQAGWSDLGHPERVIAVLEAGGFTPWWKNEWEALRRKPSAHSALPQPAIA